MVPLDLVIPLTRTHINGPLVFHHQRFPMQPKQQKTARELADMIAARLEISDSQIMVHPDPALGWHPTVFIVPTQAVRYQQLAETIAAELRATYDLKTEARLT
jgi:hypothetical protein